MCLPGSGARDIPGRKRGGQRTIWYFISELLKKTELTCLNTYQKSPFLKINKKIQFLQYVKTLKFLARIMLYA
jgi:hypothetical protein